MSPTEKKQTKLDLVGWVRDNWIWAAPLTYIYVTITGMVQAWLQFNAFGINVFEYSELNDFLLAAFREPQSFLAILGVIAYGGIAYLMQFPTMSIAVWFLNWIYRFEVGEKRNIKTSEQNKRVKRLNKVVRIYKKTYKWLFSFLFVFLFLTAPYLGPIMVHEGYDEKWKERFVSEPTRQAEVLVKDLEKKHGAEKGWIKNLALIGTTDKFAFFYNKSNKEIIIAPLNNVLLIKRVETANIAKPEDDRTSHR
jgi:hypothetical protein